MVSNHLSYVDVLVLQAQTDCAFIAKSEVAGWPILGFICRTMDTIFVERSRKRDIPHALESIERAFARGLGVVLFAEGTSTDGHGVAPFKSSLLEFAAHNRVPVHYVTLSYEAPIGEIPAAQSVCWWEDMSFGRHVFRLLKLSSFQANVRFGAQPIVSDNRRVLADQLWSAVSSQLTPAPAER
jgi:1-acyl-sn-glycerol-3-phosphate acyltransferase